VGRGFGGSDGRRPVDLERFRRFPRATLDGEPIESAQGWVVFLSNLAPEVGGGGASLCGVRSLPFSRWRRV
jgi:hypothetical protein